MRARIHRGAAEVGGSCIELEAEGRLLLLDAGLPLDEDEARGAQLPEAAERGDDRLLGAVISHSHPDHFGLVPRLDPTVPVFMGQDAARILGASSFYTGREAPPVSDFMVDRVSFELGPFCVTPYLVDHSAYDAYALLVAADGRRLFYSGDLRAHGRKRGAFNQIVDLPPPNVDVLLLEGTSVGREPTPDLPWSEQEVEDRCVEEFRSAKGMALACFSPQNIDRLVTVYRAAVRSDRSLVMDLYAAEVAAATQRSTIPQAEWECVRFYVPNAQRIRVKESEEFGRIDTRRRQRISAKELAAAPSRWVMTFRASMARELERAGCLGGAGGMWLMWPGYLDQAGDRTRETFQRLGVQLRAVHASGHAHVADLQRLATAIAADRIVPFHTAAPDVFDSLFEGVDRRADGVQWKV